LRRDVAPLRRDVAPLRRDARRRVAEAALQRDERQRAPPSPSPAYARSVPGRSPPYLWAPPARLAGRARERLATRVPVSDEDRARDKEGCSFVLDEEYRERASSGFGPGCPVFAEPLSGFEAAPSSVRFWKRLPAFVRF